MYERARSHPAKGYPFDEAQGEDSAVVSVVLVWYVVDINHRVPVIPLCLGALFILLLVGQPSSGVITSGFGVFPCMVLARVIVSNCRHVVVDDHQGPVVPEVERKHNFVICQHVMGSCVPSDPRIVVAALLSIRVV